MVSTIGLRIEDAMRRLRDVGADIVIIEYSSRKGVQNADEKRVIRQRNIYENVVELVISEFCTTLTIALSNENY